MLDAEFRSISRWICLICKKKKKKEIRKMKTARATRRVSRVVYENVSSRGKILFFIQKFPVELWHRQIWKFAEVRKKIIRFDEENERTLSDPNFLSSSYPSALILNVSRRVLENGRGNNKNWINDRTCVLNFLQVVIICTFLKKWNRSSGYSKIWKFQS